MKIYTRKIGNLWNFDSFPNFKICYFRIFIKIGKFLEFPKIKISEFTKLQIFRISQISQIENFWNCQN